MGSDSSETSFDVDGKPAFSEVDKTLYYPEINIGISTWGDAVVEGEGINEWLNRMIADFTKDHDGDHVLEKITYFLADKLDEAFGLNKKDKNESVHMGLHISGYNWTSQDALPGICHVFIDPGFKNFDPQKTMLSLPEGQTFFLRNGMYEVFAVMWPALSGIDATFRSLIASSYKNELVSPVDPVALQAEWLGNWIKQMCLMIKTAGLPEYIGKTVKVLTFSSAGNARWFHLPEMKEIRMLP